MTDAPRPRGCFRVRLLDRGGRVVEVQPGQTLLDAAEAAGERMMSGCRTGACLTCAARLVKGRVHMPEGTGLSDEMLAAHVVLPCVATAGADVELVLGRPGHTLLHPRWIRPWTD